MDRKNKIALISLASVATIVCVASTLALNSNTINQAKGECAHTHLWHQEAFSASEGKPGEREYWACCTCHDAFDLYDEEKHQLGRKIGNTLSDRSNIDLYDIAWVTPVDFGGEVGSKSPYAVAKTATKIEFVQSDTQPSGSVLCGETTNDLIYASYKDGTLTLSSKYKIAFEDDDRYGSASSAYGFFYSCKIATSMDFSNISTAKTTNFRGTFYDCTEVNDFNLSTFDTSHATNFEGMFAINASELDLTSFNTSNVTNMASMFDCCFNLESVDLSSFDTSKVIKMSRMFAMDSGAGESKLKTIYASDKFVTTALPETIISSKDMFTLCKILVGGAGTTWAKDNPTDKTYAHIDGGTANPGYFTNKNQKKTINVEITDASYDLVESYEIYPHDVPEIINEKALTIPYINESDPKLFDFKFLCDGTELFKKHSVEFETTDEEGKDLSFTISDEAWNLLKNNDTLTIEITELTSKQQFMAKADEWVVGDNGFCFSSKVYAKDQVSLEIDGESIIVDSVIYSGTTGFREAKIVYNTENERIIASIDFSGSYLSEYLKAETNKGVLYTIGDSEITYIDENVTVSTGVYKQIRMNKFGYITLIEYANGTKIEVNYEGEPE